MLSFSQEASKYHKRTPQLQRKLSKPIPKYLILQGYSEFFLLIKIQSTQISRAKRRIFNKILNFVKVAPLSTGQVFFLAEVILSRTPRSPTQKHTSKHIFHRTAPGGCFFMMKKKVLNIK